MTGQPRLETERLVLSPMQPDDFEPMAESAADAETMRYLGSPPLSRHDSWRALAAVLGHWQIRGFGFFSVYLRDSGEWIGRVGPWFPEGWPDREIGWTIARPHWGHGYATEAALACMDYAFDELGWDRVTHCIDPANTPSQRVAEKLGSRILKHGVRLPIEGVDPVDLWGQDRPQG